MVCRQASRQRQPTWQAATAAGAEVQAKKVVAVAERTERRGGERGAVVCVVLRLVVGAMRVVSE